MPQDGNREPRRTILVVDNEAIVLDFISTSLGMAGYQVVTATSAEQATQVFSRYASDLALIFVEIALPRKSGADFVSNLPTLKPRIPVIFITSFGEREIEGPLRYDFPILRKPFKYSDLKNAVQTTALQIGDSVS
jgi:CheY-like chemotaxis protein